MKSVVTTLTVVIAACCVAAYAGLTHATSIGDWEVANALETDFPTIRTYQSVAS